MPWRVNEAIGGAEALALLEESRCDALLVDRWLPDLHVDEVLATVRQRFPGLAVIVADSETGTLHPVGPQEFLHSARGRELLEFLRDPAAPPGLEAAAETAGATAAPRPAMGARVEPLPGMIGASTRMEAVYRMARLVARRDTSVLLAGETGTGKELVAQGIHEHGLRAKNPFVVVNCAAIPETLLEAELFGHVRGAFTGAVQSRLGRIHVAHGGTLLLDEVGELPVSMQAKLLRFLQDGEVQRLGSPDVFRVDVRVVCASNANLMQLVREKQFRQDLYYRLAVFPIEIPPLRQRGEDILLLAEHFLAEFCKEAGVPSKHLSTSAIQLLRQHAWPGNVRELQHAIERAFILTEDDPQLRAEHFYLPGENSRSEKS